MRRINKVDYFCGAFLSFLISNKIEPTLFEAGDNSKIVEFFIRDKAYKIFFKYSTKLRKTKVSGKEYSNWDIIFSTNEEKIIQSFDDKNKMVAVVCVCTDEDFKNTTIAILSYTDAISCLGIQQDNMNKQRRITIKHQKSSSKIFCHGTALSDKNAISIPNNYETFFELGE